MSLPATYAASELREYLFSLTLHGMKLGLKNIRILLEAAGNPQDPYPTVHVGGTNGKGSVTSMVQAILRAAGLRAGRFTSPHIIDLRERFQVDAVPISDADLNEHISYFRAVAEQMSPPPTFFEMNTAIAFRCFESARVDVAVIEVGMGGRLDATNIITPAAAAITNIDLEHTQYLGDTLELIAAEKAGIIKPGVPLVVGERRPGPLAVILNKADECAAPVSVLDRDFKYRLHGDPWRQRFDYQGPRLRLRDAPLGLAGRYQGENAAVAVALAEALQARFPMLDEYAVREGLAAARWPCRMERVLENPPVIIDAAHNVAGARKLAESIGRCVIILAVASDKDARGMLAQLAPHTAGLILSAFSDKRALPLDALREIAGDYPHECAPDLKTAIARGMAMASAASPLLITGSIYTAGEARQILMETCGAPPLQF